MLRQIDVTYTENHDTHFHDIFLNIPKTQLVEDVFWPQPGVEDNYIDK